MKTLVIEFTLQLEVIAEDRLDKDWVANKFLASDRFSTLRINGDPRGTGVIAASSGIASVRVVSDKQ